MTLPGLLQRGVAAARRRQDWVARARRVDEVFPPGRSQSGAPAIYQHRGDGCMLSLVRPSLHERLCAAGLQREIFHEWGLAT